MPKPSVDVKELRGGGVIALREKDMFSIWVKTTCCNLTSSQLRVLTDIGFVGVDSNGGEGYYDVYVEQFKDTLIASRALSVKAR